MVFGVPLRICLCVVKVIELFNIETEYRLLTFYKIKMNTFKNFFNYRNLKGLLIYLEFFLDLFFVKKVLFADISLPINSCPLI